MMKKIIFAFFATLCFSIPALADEGTGNIRGDVDLDGNVNIADVTALIDYLLTGQWPAEQAEPEVFTVNGVSFTMIPVEGGTFRMGAINPNVGNVEDEIPIHEVTLSSYYIGMTEVTQELWAAVMGSNPSEFTGANGYEDNPQLPVEMVSWNDCQDFIAKLNEMTGKTFRLPTEAEWEFATRGGNSTSEFKYSGSNDCDAVAWFEYNSENRTHPVATKAPNELGLYDMSGNVNEWCQDIYASYTSDAQTNPTGPESGGIGYVIRGGNFWSVDWQCRVSWRYHFSPMDMAPFFGLRLAL